MEDHEHIPSQDCPCEPHTLAYGEEPIYDDEGNVIGYRTEEEDSG